LFIEDNKSSKNQFDHEIYDWVTLILLLHIDYTQEKKDREGNDFYYVRTWWWDNIGSVCDDISYNDFILSNKVEAQEWVIKDGWFYENSWRLGESLHWLHTHSIEQLRHAWKRVWWCNKIPLSEKME